ncbi:hypothetical protein NU219Hw_g1553t1 [Hortaea werneckii]
MSSASSPIPPPSSHPTLGGKSIETLQQPHQKGPYKSWRKKYRKMRSRFDGVLEDNKRLFREEHKLEVTAKRLREELDGLLELCLDLNENPSIPPELRFNVRPPPRHQPPLPIDSEITPEAANAMVAEYREAVSLGRIPPLDLHVVREQIEQRLAAQGVEELDHLQAHIPHPVPNPDQPFPDDMRQVGDDPPPSYLSAAQEDDYLLRLDAKFGMDQYGLPLSRAAGDSSKLAEEEKQFAEMTPREQDRVTELQNPQSQHNWLKAHGKNTVTADDGGDTDSIAGAETQSASKPKKRGGKGNLAKQLGDRALERAREGLSPSSAGFLEEDELSFLEEGPSSGRKRGRDPDGTYRVKGGRGGGGKGKRKRTSAEGEGSGGGKKARTEAAAAEL